MNTPTGGGHGGPYRTGMGTPLQRMPSPYPRETRVPTTTSAPSQSLPENGGLFSPHPGASLESHSHANSGGAAYDFDSQFNAYTIPTARQLAGRRPSGNLTPLHSAELNRLVEEHSLSGQHLFLESFIAVSCTLSTSFGTYT